MRFQPSRTLNEPSSLMGLSIWDVAGLGYVLVLTNQALVPFGLDVISFVITGITALFIMKIRLTGRKKLIRDYVQFFIRRISL